MNLNYDKSEKVRYNNEDYPIYVRRGTLSLYPDYTAPSHWHDDIEFIFVFDGEMQYNINGESVTIKKNEGIFINTKQLHFGFSTQKKECNFLCILLHPILLCATPAYEKNFVVPLLNNCKIPYIKLNRNVLWKSEILDNLLRIDSVISHKTAPLKIQNTFITIWTLLYENVKKQDKTQIQNTDITIIKNMLFYIQNEYQKKITLSDIAASGAISESKCCKLFSKYIGRTPNGYLTQYRLDKSIDYLKNTDMSITEIAHSVGFNGSSYFAEIFHKYYKKSPSHYRKEK